MPENPQHSHSSQIKTDEELRREARAAGVPDAWADTFLRGNDEDEHRILEAYQSNNFWDEDTGRVNRPGGTQTVENLYASPRDGGPAPAWRMPPSGFYGAPLPQARTSLSPMSPRTPSTLEQLMMFGLLPRL